MTQQQHSAYDSALENLEFAAEGNEQGFWSAPPAHPLERRSILPPDFPRYEPTRARLWGARLLFVGILSAIGAISVLEVMALAKTGQRPNSTAAPGSAP